MSSSIRRRRRRQPKPDRRRALELLASSPEGCTEGILQAHGFTFPQMVELVRAGLASATGERVVGLAQDGSRDGADHRRGPVSAGKGAAMSPQRRAVTDEAQRQRRRQNAGKRLKLCVAASGWRATR
jgi:hypothetical protein